MNSVKLPFKAICKEIIESWAWFLTQFNLSDFLFQNLLPTMAIAMHDLLCKSTSVLKELLSQYFIPVLLAKQRSYFTPINSFINSSFEVSSSQSRRLHHHNQHSHHHLNPTAPPTPHHQPSSSFHHRYHVLPSQVI